jgi:predicted ester cyclase
MVTRWTGSGTHQGELMGVAPTGNQVTITGITINRLFSVKIAESWSNYDALGMLQQIGAAPSPGEQPSGTPSAGQEPPS